jgi:hypothetical protein
LRVEIRSVSAGCLLVLMVMALRAPAQQSTGAVRGVVQDTSGARMPSARISVQAAQSPLHREAVTDERGEFRQDDLLPGNYRITISAAGFAPAQAEVSIAVATVRDVTVTMKPAATSETVNVQGSSS